MNIQPLPGASTALTMGILSIVGTCFCCGPFGAIFSIIGLTNAKKALEIYEADPDAYNDVGSATTGRLLSYIGLAIAVIYLILTILYFGVIIAMIRSGDFQDLQLS